MKDREFEMAKKLAEEVAKAGGRAYLVGGGVRDGLLAEFGGKFENGEVANKAAGNKAQDAAGNIKDIDIEVHGVAPEKLTQILNKLGEGFSKGASFGVYGIRGYDLDIAMPRTEEATGRGHKDFEIFVDPHLGPEKACQRRDFTINAMMQDVLTGEILDFTGGREDLQNGILRHVSDDSFAEDPLRVLRGAQFAARFGFKIADETLELCRGIDITTLSRERVFSEMEKALLKAEKPSIFFEVLRSMGQLDCWFPELEALIGVEQSPIYHPEGDVWTHTMRVLDRAAVIIHGQTSTSPAQLQSQDCGSVTNPLYFMLSALCHDLGKPSTTAEIDGRIRAFGHETAGIEVARTFLHRQTDERDLIKYVLNMVELHMKPNSLCGQGAGVKATNRMFDRALDPEGLVLLARCDRRREPKDVAAVKPSGAADNCIANDADNDKKYESYLWERLKIYRKLMCEPQVTGEDLIAAGVKPGPGFSELMDYAHKLHLSGVAKEDALKQTLAAGLRKDH